MKKRRRLNVADATSSPSDSTCGDAGVSKPPSAVGHELILLVENEAPIRQLVRWSLKRLGYDLLEACNGSEALDVLSGHKGRLDLLLTDVVMPTMDGFDLSDRVAADHPETRILYVTAHAAESIAIRGGLVEAGHAFLLKPFTAVSLAAKVRELLDRPSDAAARDADSALKNLTLASDPGRRPGGDRGCGGDPVESSTSLVTRSKHSGQMA